jgi:hypothetical protein
VSKRIVGSIEACPHPGVEAERSNFLAFCDFSFWNRG